MTKPRPRPSENEIVKEIADLWKKLDPQLREILMEVTKRNRRQKERVEP